MYAGEKKPHDLEGLEMVKKILHFIWGLPQNLIGLILYAILAPKHAHKRYKQAYVCEMPWGGGVSLGMFIFASNIDWEPTIKHEYGHTKQSMLLGALYLLVIGLPSAVWAGCFEKYRRKHNKSYYSFYTEKWADKWGDVVRLYY